MKRRNFLKMMGGAAAATALPAIARGALATRRKPNIVLILIDDMGWTDVGCFGSTFYETPNVDRLAAEGMKFTNGYAACPVCSPTRASIMTGKYPARLQLTNFIAGRRKLEGSPILPADFKLFMPTEEVTIAEVLKGEGYATCHSGKWHLGGDKKYWPENQGFDVNIGGTGSGMPRAYFWPQWKGNPPLVGREEGEYLVDRISEDACTFIEHHRDQPFFLYLSHYAVHIPIQGKEKLVEKYEAKLEKYPPAEGRHNNPYYAAMVESVDQSVGRVLETIRRLDLENDTIVMFFSDNGGLSTPEGRHTPATTNYPLRRGKGYLYEGGIREPMIVKWPGIVKAGSTCDHPVVSCDFLPTVCEMVGIDEPETNGPIDGVSITPLLKDPAAELDREAIYWHYPHFSNQGGRPGGAVRAGDWKLIERYEFGDLELYNLADDMGEDNNLAENMPDRAKRMQQMLARWRKEVNANMPVPNPDFEPVAKGEGK